MKTYQSKDKSEWVDGEWKDEPDKAQWIDEATKLDCLIVRNDGGALCGYVGVPPDHKLFEVDYNRVYDELDVNVHGGLTFADKCSPEAEEGKGICHVGKVANDTVWWLGFDCAHCGDVSPAYEGMSFGAQTYRNFSYVKNEVTNLAAQLGQ